jgi:hypothetical protein
MKTIIRSRKMRGEDSLSGSSSFTMRVRSNGCPGLPHNMAQTRDAEKAVVSEWELKSAE